jgi:hypothetical protein
VTVQIAPAWFAMHHQHHRRIAGAFVDIMHTQGRAVRGIGKREARKKLEAMKTEKRAMKKTRRKPR